MAATIIIPLHTQALGGGGSITYRGNVTRCVWWELVGVDGGVEGAPYGALSNQQELTDGGGYATAFYTAPTVDPGVGKSDRVYVHESLAVA